MERRAPPLDAPAGRKPKAKAPLPPADAKCVTAADATEPSAVSVEQKENRIHRDMDLIDRDVELSVLLPGDVLKSTTVPGSKPTMDLLIFLCAQYHLNPSSYTIDLLSAENSTIKFKPNTPIGMLEVEKVILKPKVLDKKKPTPIIPEKTVRVVINFKKTQKAIVRVSPHASLQELVPTICSKCEFDPLHTLLLKDYQSQDPLDLTKSLNELGLRELYAMDVNRESCQIPQNLDILKEKENKGFFSFFQRSKKKREQTASAPATPLVSKHRPTFTRSNTISKPYVSNTLPSDAPKKRRAPLPPMSGSQSAPQDLAHIQERPESGVMKSMSVDETNKNPCEAGLVRTGSLQLNNTSLGNSSLKRTKRKAPSPPSKTPLHQSDESFQTADGVSEANSTEGLSSPESSLGPGLSSPQLSTVPRGASQCSGSPEAAKAALTPGISSDFSLEEIDEKEELSEVPKDEAENVSLKSQDISLGSADIISAANTVSDSALGSDMEEPSQNCKEKQDPRNTDGHIQEKVPDSLRNSKSLDPSQVPNQSVEQAKRIVIPTNTEDMKNGVRRREITGGKEARNNHVDVEVDRFPNNEAHPTGTAQNCKDGLAASRTPGENHNQSSAEKTKMQDAAIQTLPSSNQDDGHAQTLHLSDLKAAENVQTLTNHKSTQHSPLTPQDSVDTFRTLGNRSSLNVHSDPPITSRDSISARVIEDLGVEKHASVPSAKNSPLYRQGSSPRPKPSNEITRDYIPKVGMTTYKIVPPKPQDTAKEWGSESTVHKDQESHALGKTQCQQNAKEAAAQAEEAAISGSVETPEDSRQTPQAPAADCSPRSPPASPLKPAPRMRDPGTVPFAPKLEDINNILESKIKPQISNPQAKPSSFFLQMQKRASGHYVASAASKSVHGPPGPVPRRLTQREMESCPLPTAEQTLPLGLPSPEPPSPGKPTDSGVSSQKPKDTSPPPVAPKPTSPLSAQFPSLNLKTLKTFGAPRPYSSSAPSPFALAVVKRSQSFSKAPAAAWPSTGTQGGKCPPSADPCVDSPQPRASATENDSARNAQNCQVLPSAERPAFPLKRQSSLTLHSPCSDPEEIRQSLLSAIRSGEAAAKLKRVVVPSNTISVNRRSGLSHSIASDAQDDR